MTNAAERVLNAETAANELVKQLARLKTAAEALEQAHADSREATQATQDVVTALNDVMPAVARVLAQLQALDLPALTERLAGAITASGMELRERIAGEIQDVMEPLNQVATRLETLPIEPKIQELDSKAASLQTSLARLEALPAEIAAVQVAQMRIEPTIGELDSKAASLLQQAAAAAEQHEHSSAQVQTSLAKLEPLPEQIAAVQEAQTRGEQTLAENKQAALAAIESLTQQTAKRDESQAQELRRLTWILAGVMIVGLVALAVFLWLTGTG